MNERIDALVSCDLDKFFNQGTVYGTPVDYDTLRGRFRTTASWRTFLYRVRKTWPKYIKSAKLTRGEVVFLGLCLTKSINAPLRSRK